MPLSDANIDVTPLALALGESGIAGIAVHGVIDAWDVVVQQRPDLVIAFDEPEGVELRCRVMRADVRRASLPIMALAPGAGSTNARPFAVASCSRRELRPSQAADGDQVVTGVSNAQALVEQDVADIVVVERDQVLAHVLLGGLQT